MNESNANLPQLQGKESSGIGVAALGGGGVGTLLVGIAQLLPETSDSRTFLVIVAPAVSVALSSFWIWATAEYKKHRKEKVVKETITELRQYLTAQINNSNTSPQMKKQFEAQLLQLEAKSFKRAIQVIES